MDQNGPYQAKMDQNGPFCPDEVSQMLGIPGVILTKMISVAILDHLGPVHLSAVLWPLLDPQIAFYREDENRLQEVHQIPE